MPRWVKKSTDAVNPLAALMDSLVSLAAEDYARLLKAAEEGRKLRFEMETLREALS